jgi:hypothetical protein
MVAFIKQVRTQYCVLGKAGNNIDLFQLEQDFLNAQQEFNCEQGKDIKVICAFGNFLG